MIEYLELEQKKKLAAAEDTSGEILEQLSKDDQAELRELVAGNFNTPTHVLEWLSYEFPETVTANPVFPLLRLADPDSKFIAMSLALSSTTSQETLTKLAKHEDIDVRRTITMIKYLELEKKKKVAVAEDTSIEILERLSKDDTAEIRELVAGNINTPIHVLRLLSCEFPETVTANPVFSLLMLEDPNSDFVIFSLACSTTTSEETLIKLANHTDPEVRLVLIRNKALTLKVLWLLVKDQNSRIREAIAKDIKTPLSILEMLAQDNDGGVRMAVFNNSKITVEILCLLANDQFPMIREAVAENRKTPLSILKNLAQDDDKDVRLAVARNSKTTLEMLCLLANDQFPGIRQAVAKNIKTPLSILESLADDSILYVRTEVAKNLNTSPEILTKLETDPYKEVRQAVVMGKMIQRLDKKKKNHQS